MLRLSFKVSRLTDAETVAPLPCAVHTDVVTPGFAEATAGSAAAPRASRTSTLIALPVPIE
jgi:hypothetical protein